MKQYKARLEFQGKPNFHAIEVWMEADNIIQASEILINYFQPLSVDSSDVVKLIETEDKRPRHRPSTYGWGYPTCDMGHPTRRDGTHVRFQDYEAHCTP